MRGGTGDALRPFEPRAADRSPLGRGSCARRDRRHRRSHRGGVRRGGSLAGSSARLRGRPARAGEVPLPRCRRGDLVPARARTRRGRRAPAGLEGRRHQPRRRLSRRARLPRRRERTCSVSLDGRGGDPARRAHARARRMAGAAAARGCACERREPDLGADVGIARNDARGPGDVRADGRRALARGVERLGGPALGGVA